jgi:hypothetical protein
MAYRTDWPLFQSRLAAVEHAAAELGAAGIVPTNRAIAGKLGFPGPATVQPFRKALKRLRRWPWPDGRPVPNKEFQMFEINNGARVGANSKMVGAVNRRVL